jgi:cellobiose phosphorylase
MPAAYNNRAEIRQMEPYVQGQTTYSEFTPRSGNTRVAWLTGAAAWWYYAATQYVLGIRPEVHGMRIDPCIPTEWNRFQVERRYRGKMLRIEVENPDSVCSGVISVSLNGEIMDSNLLPVERLKDDNTVKVMMGNKP